MLTSYPNVAFNLGREDENLVRSIIKKANPLLSIHSVKPSRIPCEYFVTTSLLKYGAFTFNMCDLKAKKLDFIALSSPEKANKLHIKSQ